MRRASEGAKAGAEWGMMLDLTLTRPPYPPPRQPHTQARKQASSSVPAPACRPASPKPRPRASLPRKGGLDLPVRSTSIHVFLGRWWWWGQWRPQASLPPPARPPQAPGPGWVPGQEGRHAQAQERPWVGWRGRGGVGCAGGVWFLGKGHGGPGGPQGGVRPSDQDGQERKGAVGQGAGGRGTWRRRWRRRRRTGTWRRGHPGDGGRRRLLWGPARPELCSPAGRGRGSWAVPRTPEALPFLFCLAFSFPRSTPPRAQPVVRPAAAPQPQPQSLEGPGQGKTAGRQQPTSLILLGQG